MGDDAFGPWVVQTLLAGYDFPERRGGARTSGLPVSTSCPTSPTLEALVLVDTVRSDAPPGTLRLYRRDDILKHPPQPRLSPHDPGREGGAAHCRVRGARARARCCSWARCPETTAMGVRLSPALRAAVPGRGRQRC